MCLPCHCANEELCHALGRLSAELISATTLLQRLNAVLQSTVDDESQWEEEYQDGYLENPFDPVGEGNT